MTLYAETRAGPPVPVSFFFMYSDAHLHNACLCCDIRSQAPHLLAGGCVLFLPSTPQHECPVHDGMECWCARHTNYTDVKYQPDGKRVDSLCCDM